MICFDDRKNDNAILTYIDAADKALAAIGYTEHSLAHVGRVSSDTARILLELGYDEHTAELGSIAGYLHDIGNLINRVDHSQSGALMAFRILFLRSRLRNAALCSGRARCSRHHRRRQPVDG